MNKLSLKTSKILKDGFRLIKYPIVLFILVFITFQSCNKDDDSMQVNETMSKKLEYLDTDISNLSGLTEQQQVILKKASITEQQKEILKKARARIDSFVVYENKNYKLKVTSGSQIQISEKLFKFFQDQMMQTNTLIKELNVIIDKKDPKRLHVVKGSDLTNIVRLKSADIEGEIPPLNSTDYDITWSGIDFYISNHDLQLLAIGSEAVALYGALCPEAVLSKASALFGQLGAITFQYLQLENPDGVVISMDWSLCFTVQPQERGGSW